jgi:CDP-diacylglycerol--glycerol-3-phosphate 3-phosphatidyltransferase
LSLPGASAQPGHGGFENRLARPPAEAGRVVGLVNLANGLTLARMLATPLLVVVVLQDSPSWAALGLWATLAFSDMADGWVARRQGKSTSGAFLDPLADKFVVLGAMVAIASLGRFAWAAVALLVGREALITAYRVLVARHGVSVPARKAAKAKTLVEFVTVGLVLVPAAGVSQADLSGVARLALWVAVALAWFSAAQYLSDSRAGRRALAGNA